MNRRASSIGLALLAALWGATQVQAQLDAEAAPVQSDVRYQGKVAEAIAEYDRGNWAEARALFLQAHALHPNARTLRTLGMTAFELRDYASAARELEAALEHPQRPLDARLRAEVEALLERTRAFVGSVRVVLEPEGAALFVDDHPVQLAADGSLVLGLGRHTLRATARGYAPAQRTLLVEGHDDRLVELRLAPELPAPDARVQVAPAVLAASQPQPAGARVWTWVAAAGAAAFGGAALGLWVAGDHELNDLKRLCSRKAGGACTVGEVDDTKLETLDALTTASEITAGAAALAAITLFFVERAPSEADAKVRIDGAIPSLHYRF